MSVASSPSFHLIAQPAHENLFIDIELRILVTIKRVVHVLKIGEMFFLKDWNIFGEDCSNLKVFVLLTDNNLFTVIERIFTIPILGSSKLRASYIPIINKIELRLQVIRTGAGCC